MPIILQPTPTTDIEDIQQDQFNVAILADTLQLAKDILDPGIGIEPVLGATYIYIGGLHDLRGRRYNQLIEHWSATRSRGRHEAIVAHIRRHLTDDTIINAFTRSGQLIDSPVLTQKYLLDG